MSSLFREFSNYVRSPDELDSRAIAFIDSRIANCENLIQQAAPEVRVFAVGLLADGMQAITKTLSSSFCRQLYLVASGTPGCLYLGRSELSRNTLIQYQTQLPSWFKPLDNNADSETPRLHLCGCNVAAGDVGAEFLAQLSLLTGAEVSASKNIYSSLVFN
ncbi:MAG: DUF4347 domain-containing protein [Cyanobacteria bacterium J06600_6]